MQSLRRTETQPRPGPWHRRQGHLPGNLSCSDYTMCLACLWAILPFCSVKYERHSGKGKGLGKVGSQAYQFTTFEFTEPGTRDLLYPGSEPSLGVWINREEEEEDKNSSVKEGKTALVATTSPPSSFPSLSFCASSVEPLRPETVLGEIDQTGTG